jgi:hypothetical protein
MHVGSNHAAQRQLQKIATHQLCGRHSLPDPVTPDGGIEGEPRFQGKESSLGAAFLEVSQCRVED